MNSSDRDVEEAIESFKFYLIAFLIEVLKVESPLGQGRKRHKNFKLRFLADKHFNSVEESLEHLL